MTTKIQLSQKVETEVAAMALADSHLRGGDRWKAYETAKRKIEKLCAGEFSESGLVQEQFNLSIRAYLDLMKLWHARKW